MYYKEFDTVINTIILSLITYISIIIILRSSGKRTLSSFNAFDFLITVTLGSISSTIILSDNTKFIDGISAIITLVILQFIVSKLAFHSKLFNKIIKSQPTLIFYEGEYLYGNMKKMRVSKDDILQEIRTNGGVTVDKVHCVILESNGKLSVITSGSEVNLEGLKRYKD